jgi:hypothetical protein
MKRAILILLLILNINIVFAELVQQPTQVAQPPITQPQNISFERCSKMFAINKEKLFFLTLSAITANRFSIDEIQSQNGYIIFSAANNKYLATVAGIDSDNSILKITPCNDIYFFPPGIFLGIFKYIELNLNMEIK